MATITEIKARVKAETRINTTTVDTIIGYNIDEVQDNYICKNIYNHIWSWLKGYGEISTTDYYTTGTVSITHDSTAVTGSGTTFATGVAGQFIKFGSQDEVYKISTRGGATSLTLSTAYIGATLSGETYAIYYVYYDLPSDFGNMIVMTQKASPRVIQPNNSLSFAHVYPDEFDRSTGEITDYILSGVNTSTLYKKIRFSPIQTSSKRVYFEYMKQLPSAQSSDSQIPTSLHPLIITKLKAIVYKIHDLPAKAAEEEVEFDKQLRTAINNDKQITMDNNTVMADENVYPQYYKKPRVNLPDNYPGFDWT